MCWVVDLACCPDAPVHSLDGDTFLLHSFVRDLVIHHFTIKRQYEESFLGFPLNWCISKIETGVGSMGTLKRFYD